VDSLTERLDNTAKRMFGADAAVSGCVGTATAPGELRILVDGHVVGRGESFQEALSEAALTLGRRAGDRADDRPGPSAAGPGGAVSDSVSDALPSQAF